MRLASPNDRLITGGWYASSVTDTTNLNCEGHFVAFAQAEVLKHVGETEMVPHADGEPHYEACGEWNLLGEDETRELVGDR